MPKSSKKSSSAKRRAKKAKEAAKKIAEQQQQVPAQPTPSPQQGSDPPTTVENPTVSQPSPQTTPAESSPSPHTPIQQASSQTPASSTIVGYSSQTQSSSVDITQASPSSLKTVAQETPMIEQPTSVGEQKKPEPKEPPKVRIPTSVEEHKEIDPDLIPKGQKTPDSDKSDFLAPAMVKPSARKKSPDSQSQSVVATVVGNPAIKKKKEEREARWSERKRLKELEVSSEDTPKIQNSYVEQPSQILNDSDIMSITRKYFDQVDNLMDEMDLRMDENVRAHLQENFSAKDGVIRCLERMMVTTERDFINLTNEVDPMDCVRNVPESILADPNIATALVYAICIGLALMEYSWVGGEGQGVRITDLPKHVFIRNFKESIRDGVWTNIEQAITWRLRQRHNILPITEEEATEDSSMIKTNTTDHVSQKSKDSSKKSQKSPIEVITVDSDSSAVTGITAASQVSQRMRQQNIAAKQTKVNHVSSKVPSKSQVEVETVISHASGETGITTASHISRRMRQQQRGVSQRQGTRKKQHQAKSRRQTGDQKQPQPIVHPENAASSQKSRGDINSQQVNMPSPILSSDEKTSANATSKSKKPFVGTLLNMTELSPDQQTAILDILNNRQSPRSDSQPKPREISFQTQIQEEEEEPDVVDLTKDTDDVPEERPMEVGIPITPQQMEVLEYMRKIKALTPETKEVKRSNLPATCKFDGTIAKFSIFRNIVEGHYTQQQAAYLFNPEFVKQYAEYGPACYINFPGTRSELQVKMDVEALFGAIQQSCATPALQAIIIKHKDPPNGVAAWQDLIKKFGSSGAKEIRVEELENVVGTAYTASYKGGLTAWVQDYENAFAELDALGDTTFAGDEKKKKRLLRKFASPNSHLGMVLKELCKNQTFEETCQTLRVHGLSGGSAKPARMIHNTSKMDELVNLISDRVNSNLTIAQEPPAQDQVVNTLAHLSRLDNDIWRKLPRDIQQLIMEHRRNENSDATERKSEDPKTKPKELPRQYTKANVTFTEPNEEMIEEYLSQALEMDIEEEAPSDDLDANINVVRVSVTNEQATRCMNSMFIEPTEKVMIIDNGADTCVLGQGWHIAQVHSTRKANVMGFDHHLAVKKDLGIVDALTAVDTPKGTILLQVNEAVYNPTSEHSLLSEFQMREYGTTIDSVPRRHGGKARMEFGDEIVNFGLVDCLNYFKARVPTDQELNTLKPHELTQGVIQWNPRSSRFNAPVDPSLENLINVANDTISTVLQDRHLNMHAVAETDHSTQTDVRIKSEDDSGVEYTVLEEFDPLAQPDDTMTALEESDPLVHQAEDGLKMNPVEENTQEQGGIIPFPDSVHSFNPSDQHSSDFELVETPSTPMAIDPDDIVPVESNLTMSATSQE